MYSQAFYCLQCTQDLWTAQEHHEALLDLGDGLAIYDK